MLDLAAVLVLLQARACLVYTSAQWTGIAVSDSIAYRLHPMSIGLRDGCQLFEQSSVGLQGGVLPIRLGCVL